jgi:hypothetical protein
MQKGGEVTMLTEAGEARVRCSVGGQIVEAFARVSEFEHPDEVRGALLTRTCR